jgi:hypothetical protein
MVNVRRLVKNSEFIDNLISRIKGYHGSQMRVEIEGKHWEDIFDSILCIINRLESTWKPGGHHIGFDVVCGKYGTRYQNKSGSIRVIGGVATVTWSGHRTTKYPTIGEKVAFISEKHCDEFVFLARNKREWSNGELAYYFINFDSSLIDYSLLEWTETYSKSGKLTGWAGKSDKVPYTAKISLSMSAQLWTSCPLSYFEDIIRIDATK